MKLRNGKKQNAAKLFQKNKIIAIIIAILLACCIAVGGIMLFTGQKSLPVEAASSSTSITVITKDKDGNQTTDFKAGDTVYISVTIASTRTDVNWSSISCIVAPIKNGAVDLDALAHLNVPSEYEFEKSSDYDYLYDNFVTTSRIYEVGIGTNITVTKGIPFSLGVRNVDKAVSATKAVTYGFPLTIDSDYEGAMSFGVAASYTNQVCFMVGKDLSTVAANTDDAERGGLTCTPAALTIEATNKGPSTSVTVITKDKDGNQTTDFKAGDTIYLSVTISTTRKDLNWFAISCIIAPVTSSSKTDTNLLKYLSFPNGYEYETTEQINTDFNDRDYLVTIGTGRINTAGIPLGLGSISTSRTNTSDVNSINYEFPLVLSAAFPGGEITFGVEDNAGNSIVFIKGNDTSTLYTDDAEKGGLTCTPAALTIEATNNEPSTTVTVITKDKDGNQTTDFKAGDTIYLSVTIASTRTGLNWSAIAYTIAPVKDGKTDTDLLQYLSFPSDFEFTPSAETRGKFDFRTYSIDIGTEKISTYGVPLGMYLSGFNSLTSCETSITYEFPLLISTDYPGGEMTFGAAKSASNKVCFIVGNDVGTQNANTDNAERGSLTCTPATLTIEQKQQAEAAPILSDIRIDYYDDGNNYSIKNYNPETYAYKVYVPSNSDHPRITAKAANNKAEIVMKVDGDVVDSNTGWATDIAALKGIGSSVTVEIIVTLDGGSSTYTLTVIRASGTPYLTYLTVGTYQLFDGNDNPVDGKDEEAVRDVPNFYVTIENADTNVVITAESSGEDAEVKINGTAVGNGSGVLDASIGALPFEGATARIQISINPQFGNTVVHYLYITRKPALSDNTNAAITIDEITADYNATIFNTEYAENSSKLFYGTYHVPYTVFALTVTVTVEDLGELVAPATYEIYYDTDLQTDATHKEYGNVKLAYGCNHVHIHIIASDGTVRPIVVSVIREKPTLYPNPTIEEISEFTDDYTADVTNYKYVVAHDVKKLTVHANWDQTLYDCVITGADNLKTGLNTVTISLIEKDQGVSRTAASADNAENKNAVEIITIEVYREGNNASTVWLILFLMCLLLAIIGAIIVAVLLTRIKNVSTPQHEVAVAKSAPTPATIVNVPAVEYVPAPVVNVPAVEYVSVSHPVEVERPQQPVNVEVNITGCGDSDGRYKTKK